MLPAPPRRPLRRSLSTDAKAALVAVVALTHAGARAQPLQEGTTGGPPATSPGEEEPREPQLPPAAGDESTVGTLPYTAGSPETLGTTIVTATRSPPIAATMSPSVRPVGTSW